VLVLQSGGPNDVPLGRYIRETGLATPFVVLFFMSIWGFPLITALVAGDIVAAETHNGTLKTILTRSRERGQVFAGKVLASFTYTLAVIVGMAFVGTVAASIASGFRSRRRTSRSCAVTSPASSADALSVGVRPRTVPNGRSMRASSMEPPGERRTFFHDDHVGSGRQSGSDPVAAGRGAEVRRA